MFVIFAQPIKVCGSLKITYVRILQTVKYLINEKRAVAAMWFAADRCLFKTSEYALRIYIRSATCGEHSATDSR